MKFTGEIIKADDGVIIISYLGFLEDKLEIDKKYTIEIKPYKSKRSLDQNAMAWLMIEKIADKTDNDKWDIYCRALKQANQKAEYILALPQAENSLKEVYRVVEMLDETREVNGTVLNIFKCYLGSSKLNTSDFAKFIDYLIRLCSELGIHLELDNLF